MKVLFIKSTINSVVARADFGVGSLSAMLKKHGHEVGLFVVQKLTDIPLLAYRISLTKPDILAFSTYASAFQSTVRISNILRKQYPNMLQIMGGIHLVLNPDDIQQAPSVDAVCIGEGEYALLEFIKNYSRGNNSHYNTPGFWTRKKGLIIKNPSVPFVHNIELLPLPDREIFNQQNLVPSYDYDGKTLVLEFLFTRGCPFSCTYCSNHALQKIYGSHEYVRRLSPKRAIEWIQRDLAIYACERISVLDDTFTLDRKWAEEFLRLYRKTIDIPFSCNLRVGTFDKPILRKLKSAGCAMVALGVESGNEELRKEILKRSMTNKELINAFDWIKKLRFLTIAYLMIGIPGETPKAWLDTVKFTAKILPDTRMLSTFYPFPGTTLHRISKSMGFLRHKPRWDFVQGTGESILSMPNFSKEDILYYHNNVDVMVNLCIPSKNVLIQLHRKITFFLLSIPPSASYYLVTHSLVSINSLASRFLHYFKLVRHRFMQRHLS